MDRGSHSSVDFLQRFLVFVAPKSATLFWDDMYAWGTCVRLLLSYPIRLLLGKTAPLVVDMAACYKRTRCHCFHVDAENRGNWVDCEFIGFEQFLAGRNFSSVEIDAQLSVVLWSVEVMRDNELEEPAANRKSADWNTDVRFKVQACCRSTFLKDSWVSPGHHVGTTYV